MNMADENAQAMNEDVRCDLINTLHSIKLALEKRDAEELKELSNHTMHCTTIYEEKRAVYIAIIAYSLGKTLEKGGPENVEVSVFEEFINGLFQNFGALISFLENKDFEKFDNSLSEMMRAISEFETSFGKYILDVLHFAKIQKGARIYEHGLSLSKIAEMIGVSKWELMSKVGEAKEHKGATPPKNIKERFEKIRKLVKE